MKKCSSSEVQVNAVVENPMKTIGESHVLMSWWTVLEDPPMAPEDKAILKRRRWTQRWRIQWTLLVNCKYWCSDERLGRFPPWLPKTKQCWKGSGEHSGGAATELDSSIHLFEQFYHLGSVKSLQMTTSPDQLSSLTCLCQIFLRSATKRKAYSNMVEEHETENKTPKSYFYLTAALS